MRISNIKTSLLLTAVLMPLLLLSSCSKPERSSAKKKKSAPALMLATTPVKDQGGEQACWIYAMLACIETDRIEQYGDSVDLSPEWVIKALYKENALRQRVMGRGTKSQVRGMGPDALRLIEHYGLIPNGTRPGKDDGFYLYSMQYTPRQLAGSVYQPGDWQWLTSFSHHKYGERFALEVPDNTHFNEFLNVPPDSLLAITLRSLNEHHPVFWEGTMKDIRNTGNKSASQLASRRQKLFESHVLTDDHAMAIVGLHRKKDGSLHFIMKNSWGKSWGKNGYGILPVNDFLLRTIMIGVREYNGK